MKRNYSILTGAFIVIILVSIFTAPDVEYGGEIAESLLDTKLKACYLTYEGYIDYIDYCTYEFPISHRFKSGNVQVIYGVVKSLHLVPRSVTLGEIHSYYRFVKRTQRKTICVMQYISEIYFITVITERCNFFEIPLRLYFYNQEKLR